MREEKVDEDETVAEEIEGTGITAYGSLPHPRTPSAFVQCSIVALFTRNDRTGTLRQTPLHRGVIFILVGSFFPQ
jgi:hypothetical protein